MKNHEIDKNRYFYIKPLTSIPFGGLLHPNSLRQRNSQYRCERKNAADLSKDLEHAIWKENKDERDHNNADQGTEQAHICNMDILGALI